MKLVPLFCLVLIASAFALTSAEEELNYDDSENVISLQPSEVEEFLADEQNKFVFMEFYAPWCGHCKNLKPEWEEAAKIAKEKNLPVSFVAVRADQKPEDAMQNPLLKYQIKGFPTVKFFSKGQPNDYEGLRTADGMISYATKFTKDPILKLSLAEDLEKFKAGGETTPVIGYFPEGDEANLETFLVSADKFKLVMGFGQVTDPALCQAEGITEATIRVYHADEEVDELTKQKEVMTQHELLSKWILSHSFPAFSELTSENINYRFVLQPEKPSLILFTKEGESEEEKKVLKKIAVENRDEVKTFFLDGIKFDKLVERLGFEEKAKLPLLAVICLTEKNHYRFDDDGTKEINEENVAQFVQDLKDNKLTRKRKSAPIPEENNDDVFVIVGDTFQEVTEDPTKDVLVLFHAPWCGHCKQFMPIYKEAAAALKGVESLRIASIDMDANEATVPIKGFPTVLLFRANHKDEPKVFENERSIGEIFAFLKRNVDIQIIVPVSEEEKEVIDEVKAEAEEKAAKVEL